MVGQRLADTRLARGHTQESLAEIVGTSIRQISRYETGRGLPSAEMLAELAMALDVSIDYLLGLSDVMHRVGPGDLTEPERLAIDAWRHGDRFKAIQIIATDESLET